MNTLNLLIRQAITDQSTNARQLTLGGNALQLCNPPLSWDWEISPTGTISSNMFTFCNSVPDDPDADTFVAGGNFFDAYQGFLAWLNDDFIPQHTLQRLLQLASQPIGSPNDIAAPDGWVKVNDGGELLRWQPAYSATNTPKNWKLHNRIEDAPALNIPINDIPLSIFKIVDSDNNDHPIDINQVDSVSLTAKAWDRVRISPGKWYNSTMVDQARTQNGVFKQDQKINKLVGANKLLSARISEILVVMEPVLHIVTRDAATNELLASSEANAVQVAEVTIENPNVSQQTTADGTTHWQLGSNPDQPYILGVFLEKFYRSGEVPPRLNSPLGRRAMPVFPSVPAQPPQVIKGSFAGNFRLSGTGKHHINIVADKSI
jgi:hypothetical protein